MLIVINYNCFFSFCCQAKLYLKDDKDFCSIAANGRTRGSKTICALQATTFIKNFSYEIFNSHFVLVLADTLTFSLYSTSSFLLKKITENSVYKLIHKISIIGHTGKKWVIPDRRVPEVFAQACSAWSPSRL